MAYIGVELALMLTGFVSSGQRVAITVPSLVAISKRSPSGVKQISLISAVCAGIWAFGDNVFISYI